MTNGTLALVVFGVATAVLSGRASADFAECSRQCRSMPDRASVTACQNKCADANPVPNHGQSSMLGVMTAAACKSLGGIPDSTLTSQSDPDPPRPCRRRPSR